jgi:hypothetical protein
MILILDSKRRLTLPKNFIQAEPGDYFEAFYDVEDEAIVFRKLQSGKDWLDVLKECPVSMDDLTARSRDLPKKIRL